MFTALTYRNINVEALAGDIHFPSNTIDQLKGDITLADSFPAISCRNLLENRRYFWTKQNRLRVALPNAAT